MLCSGSRATPALGPNQIAPEFPNMLAVGVCVEGLDYLEVPGASGRVLDVHVATIVSVH